MEFSLLQGLAHQRTKRLHFMQGFDCWATVLSSGYFLLLEYRPGVMRRAGKKQHQIGLEFAKQCRILFHWFDSGLTVRIKQDVIQASKSSSILILFSNLFT